MPVGLFGLDAVFPSDEVVGPSEALAVAHPIELGRQEACPIGGQAPHQSEQRGVEHTGAIEHPVIGDEAGRTRTPQVVLPPPDDLRFPEPPDQIKPVSLLVLELEVLPHACILASIDGRPGPALRLTSVSLFRGIDHGEFERGGRAQPAVEERRKATSSGVLGTGTLACRRCDAPIDPGARPLSLTESLVCPFCDGRGPVRDFLSLASPTRPARVVVRVTLPAR